MPAPAHILFVCTANQCRSPMAEALLRTRLHARGLDTTVAVSSAGTYGDGAAATAEAAEVVAERGGDLSAHRARLLTADVIDGADLVVALAREHAREAVVLRPDAFGRVFVLKDLVRRAESARPRGDGEELAAYTARLGAGRDPADMLGRSTSDDVDDPIGRSLDVYRRTATEIDGLMARLVHQLWPD